MFFCFFLSCCSNNPQKKAKRLHDRAIFMTCLKSDTATQMAAIQLLNKATDLQPDYFGAHANKLIFQQELGLYDDAFNTLIIMEQLKPKNPDLKSIIGAFCEYYHKDTLQAMLKYEEADLLYHSILDTIQFYSPMYKNVIIYYAMNLRLLKTTFETITMTNSFFEHCYCDDNNKQECEDIKKMLETLIEKQTRDQLLVSKFFTPIGSIWYDGNLGRGPNVAK
jgi:tetratricopeptide (TPR) repeat protein